MQIHVPLDTVCSYFKRGRVVSKRGGVKREVSIIKERVLIRCVEMHVPLDTVCSTRKGGGGV